MKSIENSTVLNPWASLVDFLNEHWVIATSTSMEIVFSRSAFISSCRFCDTDNESAGYKESYETELPKLPCHKADSKIYRTPTNMVSKRAKFNIDFKNSGPFRKTTWTVRDEKLSLMSPKVRKSLAFFCKQTRIGIVPIRKAGPNILLIAPKRDFIDA